MNPRILPRVLAVLVLLGSVTTTPAAELAITTTRRDTGEVIPARIHLAGPGGFQRDPGKRAGRFNTAHPAIFVRTGVLREVVGLPAASVGQVAIAGTVLPRKPSWPTFRPAFPTTWESSAPHFK